MKISWLATAALLIWAVALVCLPGRSLMLHAPAAEAPAAVGVQVERDVPVAMRDGVVLRADVYRPADGGPYPVLVMRTPYGKQGSNKFNAFVKAGYIVVCQDVRGRYASEGTFESFVREQTHDAEDGYDTVEWAARLPNSTGKVGTFGRSYDAFLQWRLAPLRPRSLVAMSAQSIPARYTDLEGPGTIRPGRRLRWWATTLSPDLRRRARRPGPTRAEALALWSAGEGQNLLYFLPWAELPDQTFEDEAAVVRSWLQAPQHDPWRLDALCKEIAVPNLDVVGWYDHCNGDMRLFRTMVQEGMTETVRKGQRLVVGPWSHSAPGRSSYGTIDFGPQANMDLADLEIRWFDHWLKGKPNGVDKDPPVRLFVMGANQWRQEQTWPLSRARKLELFLTSERGANTAAGDGKLVHQISQRSGKDTYRYDPRNPVPSLYGPDLFTVPTDQRPLAGRRDILVYQTEPLQQAIEVTGNPEVTLYAASSAPDTDFFARLIDVAPDGLARDVSLGVVRARFRHGLDKPEFLKPGAITAFAIRMSATSNRFAPDHRLRLDITSSDFPNYDRNHNTDRNQNSDATLVVAQQTVHHGPLHTSKLVLPVITTAR